MVDTWDGWMCEQPECNLRKMMSLLEPDQPQNTKWRLGDLLKGIRPDVEVAGWVYKEIEKIFKEA
jgi:hypothetical protein